MGEGRRKEAAISRGRVSRGPHSDPAFARAAAAATSVQLQLPQWVPSAARGEEEEEEEEEEEVCFGSGAIFAVSSVTA